jgi:hypothetical protein
VGIVDEEVYRGKTGKVIAQRDENIVNPLLGRKRDFLPENVEGKGGPNEA